MLHHTEPQAAARRYKQFRQKVYFERYEETDEEVRNAPHLVDKFGFEMSLVSVAASRSCSDLKNVAQAGSYCRVFWPLEDQWFDAYISFFSTKLRCFYIVHQVRRGGLLRQ